MEQIVDRLIGLVGAEDVAEAQPSSLSTGRKRAVAMARALAAQPEIVLYDEPTTMVDPIIARRLGGLIQRLKRQVGFTVDRGHARHALCPDARRHRAFFFNQGRASSSVRDKVFLNHLTPTSANFLPWMLTYCLRNKEFISFQRMTGYNRFTGYQLRDW